MTSLFFYQISDKQKRWNWYWKLALAIIVLVVIIYSFIDNFSGFNVSGFRNFSRNFIRLFTPDTARDYFLGSYLLQTIFYVVSGSILGFVIALWFSYLTAFKIQPLYIALPTRLFTIFLRSFPVLVFAFLFNNLFNKQLTATLTITWFSWLWSTKYITAFFENSALKQFFNQSSRYIHKFKAFWNTVVISQAERLWLFLLYSLEANFRWTTVLSIAGITGIGELIATPLGGTVQLNLVLIPMLTLIGFLLFLEASVFLLTKFVLQKQSQAGDYFLQAKTLQKRKWKKVMIYILALVLAAFTLANLVQLDYTVKAPGFVADFFKQFFQTKTAFLISEDANINPLLMLLKLTTQAISLIILVFVLALLFGFLASKLFSTITSISLKLLLLVIRVIPSVLLFRLFDPIIFRPETTIIFVLAIHSAASYGQLITINFDNANEGVINNMQNHGFSRFYILWNYLIPTTKPQLLNTLSDSFDNAIRDLVVFGIFGGSIIGGRINNFFERAQYSELGTITLPLMVYLMVFEVILMAVRLNKLKVWQRHLW